MGPYPRAKSFKKKKHFTPLKGKSTFNKVLKRTVLDVLEGLGSSKSLALAISLRHTNTVEADLLTLDPNSYLHVRDLQIDSQAVALFKKSVYMPYDKGEREREAIEHFLTVDAELSTTMNDLPISADAGFIYECQRLIHSILGDVPDLRYTDAMKDKIFTSGSVTGKKLKDSTIAEKLSRVVEISPNAIQYMNQLCIGNPCFKKVLFTQGLKVTSSKSDPYEVQVVPKVWNKDRTIVKTHFGDMILQRSFAAHIRKRLLKCTGIDLSTAQDLHKFIIKNFHEEFATIDLSDASDRISTALVKLLLPLDWFLTLSRIKNDYVKFPDGTIYRMNKFCSQGNGFTFELETLLFYCIAVTAIRRSGYGHRSVFIYGDDTIVPVASGVPVMEAYEKCGLVVNRSKSFVNTPFKESCGVDTFNGIECRPVYFKDFKEKESLPYAYIKLANRVWKIGEYLFSDPTFSSPINRAIVRIRHLFKDDYRHECPESLGDLAFISANPKKFFDTGNGQYYYRIWKKSYTDARRQPVEEASQLAYILLGNDSKGSLPRNSRFRIQSARIYGVYHSTNRP